MAAAPASRLNENSIRDFFDLFGFPRRFGIDRAALERRFYELSRETHPDRFATAGAEALRRAVERMSLLNEAYRTLKDPVERRQYFLRLEGFEQPAEKGSAQIPAELAESWFELQDTLMENPDGAAAKVAAFERELADLRARAAEKLSAIERGIDEAASGGQVSREWLQRLSDGIREQSYLKSMERDVERIKARIAGSGR